MDWKKPENKRLIEAILSLSTPDEARRFLRDLMTKGELEEFAKRLRTAEMLTQKIPYKVIEKETGFSSTTVARVARWLNGSEGGYGTIIKKLHHYNTHHIGRGLSLARFFTNGTMHITPSLHGTREGKGTLKNEYQRAVVRSVIGSENDREDRLVLSTGVRRCAME